jgi:hypothetical protein
MITNKGTVLSFNSSGVIRCCKVIKCEDPEFKAFLSECVEKNSEGWKSIKLDLIKSKSNLNSEETLKGLQIQKLQVTTQ